MKYDILHRVREHLNREFKPATAKAYYQALKGLLRDCQFTDAGQLAPEALERRLQGCKTKNDFSAAKRGLLAFAQVCPELRLPPDSFFKETAGKKRNFKKRTFEPVKLDTIRRKINTVKDGRKKTAYRLALVSGLRVSELAALESENIQLENGDITVFVIDGKGGKDRIIQCLPDDFTYRRLEELLKTAGPGERIFPAAAALQEEAGKKGFECHDLRRAFARCYKEHYRGTAGAYEINGRLMEEMGHARFRTTRVYLNRKIAIGGKHGK